MIEFRAYDSQSVQSVLKSIYADCRFDFVDDGRARFRISDYGFVSVFDVISSSPFSYSCAEKSKTLIIHQCIEGGIDYRRDNEVLQITRGDIVPISSTQTSGMTCNSSIAHQSISIDEEMLNRQFHKFSNKEIDGPIEFKFDILSEKSKKNINNVIKFAKYFCENSDMFSFDCELFWGFFSYIIFNELDGSHNKSHKLSSLVSDQAYRDAEAHILRNARQGVSIEDLASITNCSISDLNRKFLENLNVGINSAIICANRASADRSIKLNDASLSDIVKNYTNFTSRNPFEHLITLHVEDANLDEISEGLSPEMTELSLHYINTNLSHKISIKAISELLGMSRQTFTKSFKNAVGVNPYAYILEERLKWAQWMIRNTDEKLSAIAIEVGFSSQSHMTTSLMKLKGFTPNEFRNRKLYV